MAKTRTFGGRRWGTPPWKVTFRPKRTPLPEKVDFVLVGGGFTGLSAAAHLRRLAPRKSVLLLEAETLGNGASGRTGGMALEGRGLAKGNPPQQNASRTPSRSDAPSALERVRQTAEKDKKLRFTALLHHIYNLDTLRRTYFSLKKEAAPRVDGEMWRPYGEELEANLRDLSERLKRRAYRAKPVRRVYIPKADGRQRPLGVTALEDKIVQRAAVEASVM
jgi:glycine/D-amino acid oxidase-like deaminating enzyme